MFLFLFVLYIYFPEATELQSFKAIEAETWRDTFILMRNLLQTPRTPLSVVEISDKIDLATKKNNYNGNYDNDKNVNDGNSKNTVTSNSRELFLLKITRKSFLVSLLKSDRRAYIETVKFLGAKISRNDLPNLQGEYMSINKYRCIDISMYI